MEKAKAMKKAQSILEYLVMLSVIVGAILFASNGMQTKIQTARNGVADSIGNSFGLNASLVPIPPAPTEPINPNDPVVPPVPTAQVFIPTSVMLLPSELAMLDGAGILQSGRSDYDPSSRTILRVGLSAAQNTVIDTIQKAVNKRYGV
jgi:hypothetical protein